MSNRPKATNVNDRDEFGPYCRDCGGAVYPTKIERGPKIGVRVTWEHVSRTCNRLPVPLS